MCSVVADSLRPHGLKPIILLWPWNFPGKNTGVGCLFLLPGIFLTQELSPSLLHCRQILYHWATWEAMERLNRLPLSCPPTPVTVQSTDGERARWPRQSRAGSSSVYKEFSFTCYIKGDPRLCWGNENGSSRIYIQAGTWAPLVTVWALSSNLFTKNWGWSRLPLGCPPGVHSRHPPPFQCPPFWQKHIGSGPGGFLGVCPAFSVLQGPFEVVAESKQLRAAFSLLVFYAYWPPPSSLGS